MLDGKDSDFPRSSAGNYNSSRVFELAEKVIKKDRRFERIGHAAKKHADNHM